MKAGEMEGKQRHEIHAVIANMYSRNQEYESVVDEYCIFSFLIAFFYF